ncbi:hypothetical protein WH47_09853 [Habropoda laboriosa]|uniref:Uncharacterized protein n=1 Tax=Habropoda laboriosa TaxID=597456 RepID=A0A0L7R373_9HYME|nr:hypothetical protein WH47_09853 [Habropoda laboriosa]
MSAVMGSVGDPAGLLDPDVESILEEKNQLISRQYAEIERLQRELSDVIGERDALLCEVSKFKFEREMTDLTRLLDDSSSSPLSTMKQSKGKLKAHFIPDTKHPSLATLHQASNAPKTSTTTNKDILHLCHTARDKNFFESHRVHRENVATRPSLSRRRYKGRVELQAEEAAECDVAGLSQRVSAFPRDDSSNTLQRERYKLKGGLFSSTKEKEETTTTTSTYHYI